MQRLISIFNSADAFRIRRLDNDIDYWTHRCGPAAQTNAYFFLNQ